MPCQTIIEAESAAEAKEKAKHDKGWTYHSDYAVQVEKAYPIGSPDLEELEYFANEGKA